MLNGDSSTLYDRAAEHQPRAWPQWYAFAMRRWFASVLLLLTALLPLQPLIASAQADASLPACCRRSGAHHCMMMQSMMLTDSGTQTSVRPAPCPLWKITVSPAVVAVAAAPLLIPKPSVCRRRCRPRTILPCCAPHAVPLRTRASRCRFLHGHLPGLDVSRFRSIANRIACDLSRTTHSLSVSA